MTENPRNAMVWATPYLKNEFGDPRFFLRFLIESYHFLSSVKVLKKSVYGKFLRANVLKCTIIHVVGFSGVVFKHSRVVDFLAWISWYKLLAASEDWLTMKRREIYM